MNATFQRDQVCDLVKQSPQRALQKARNIKVPWFKAQALSWVARFTDDDPIQVAKEAAHAARLGTDAYQQVAVRAWEIAALAERGEMNAARHALYEAIAASQNIFPPSSKSEARMLLLHASARVACEEMRIISEVLLSGCGMISHWRCARAIRDATALLSKRNVEVAKDFASHITDDKTRKRAEKAIQYGGEDVRPFFW